MDALDLIDLKRNMRRIEEELEIVRKYAELALTRSNASSQTLQELLTMMIESQTKVVDTARQIETYAVDEGYCEVCDIQFPEDEPCRLH